MMGLCAKCPHPQMLTREGRVVHHYRLRRRRWLSCTGSGLEPKLPDFPVGITLGHVVDPDHDPGELERNLARLERGPRIIDKRASSVPDEPRYVVGVDPGNPTGPAVVIDSVTGEVVYRRKSGAKGVQ